MATYYVRPDGLDTNTGLAPTSAAGTGAWRTVNKALSVAAGGDTVWISAGTYRENVTTSLAVQSSVINIKGDPSLTQVAWGSGLASGPVRITNFLTNDTTASSGVTLSLTDKRYYTFDSLRFEGTFSLVRCRDITFYRCAWIGNGTESIITTTLQSQAYADFIDFYRCSLVNMPITNTSMYQATNKTHYNYFRSCLIQVCNNASRNNSWFNSNSSDKIAYGTGIFLNCTFISGFSTPSYITNNAAWGQIQVNNCLFLTTATANTFYNFATGIDRVNFCYGYSLSQSGLVVSNSTTIIYNSTDVGDNTLTGLSNYYLFAPHADAIYLNAGTTSDYTTTWSIPGYPNYPTQDFFGNAWNSPTTPTVGCFEARPFVTITGTGGYVPLDRAVQTITTTAGSTGVSVHIYLGSTGVTYQTPNLTCYYARDNGASVQIPLVQGNASTWVSGGLFEVSSTTMPGVYKFDIPNAVIQAGAKSASIMLRGANAFNGAFININIEGEPQPNYVSTNEFRLASENAGYNNVLELNANTATTVKLQLLDMYQAPTNLTGATLSVEVYNSTNNLIATYIPTVRYSGNGEITFVLSTDVSATYGDYNVYCTKTSGSTDSVVYGPLSLRIRRL
jgi:hypothetical protein